MTDAKTRQRMLELIYGLLPDAEADQLRRQIDDDPELAKALSLFITGDLYAREKLPHPIRQLITVGALTVLSRPEELRLHIQAALNVGCQPKEIAEAIFQTLPYGGVPAANTALKTLRSVLQERGLWPLETP